MSDFKMTPKPEDASDSMIARLFDEAMKPAEALAKAFNRLESIMHKPPVPTVTELLFHTNRRRVYEFAQVPVGHDLGWCCYDPNTYDGAADGNRLMGYGKTQDEAYVDLLHQLDDEPAKVAPKIHSSPFEPDDYGTPRRAEDPDEEQS